VAGKQLALALAQAERAALPATATPDAIATADLKVTKARIELNAVSEQYKGILGANFAVLTRLFRAQSCSRSSMRVTGECNSSQ